MITTIDKCKAWAESAFVENENEREAFRQAASELEALQNKTTELKAFCDDVEGLLQAERNQNQGLRDQLKKASVLIEKIGTTGVERTDIILKAGQWLKNQP